MDRKLRCKWCKYVVTVSPYGDDGFETLRLHVAVEHPDEFEALQRRLDADSRGKLPNQDDD